MRLTAQNIGMKIEINEDLARDLVNKLHEVFVNAGEDMPKHLGDAVCDLQIQLDNEEDIIHTEGANLTNEKDERVFNLIYVDEGLDSKVDCESVKMSVDAILHMINDEHAHSSEFIPYDRTDWIDGLLEMTSYDLILIKGDVMRWTDPDNEQYSGNVIVSETTRLIGGFGVESASVECNNGQILAQELS